MRERPPAQVQKFQYFVKGRRVRATIGADGKESGQVARNDVTAQVGFASAHPVAVAVYRIDFTVVRDQAVRVSQRPRGEGVGRKARVHQTQCRLHA